MVDGRKTAFGTVLSGLGNASPGALLISEWPDMAAATVMTCAGESIVAERLASVGQMPAVHPIKIGPGVWLVLNEQPAVDWLAKVTTALAENASVFDQSGAFAVLRFEGRDALRLLKKGLFVDLDQTLSADGASVSSVVSHVSVTTWRISADTFGVAVPRSYAGSFWHWLTASAAAEKIELNHLS